MISACSQVLQKQQFYSVLTSQKMIWLTGRNSHSPSLFHSIFNVMLLHSREVIQHPSCTAGAEYNTKENELFIPTGRLSDFKQWVWYLNRSYITKNGDKEEKIQIKVEDDKHTTNRLYLFRESFEFLYTFTKSLKLRANHFIFFLVLFLWYV